MEVVIFGIFSVILSSIGTGLSDSVLSNQQNYNEYSQKINNITKQNQNLHLNYTHVVGTVSGVLSSAMIFTILLLIGIKKNKPGFILAYFVYGLLLNFVLIISAILEFIHSYWYLATASIIISGIYTWCLYRIRNLYELMEQESMFDSEGPAPCPRHEVLQFSDTASCTFTTQRRVVVRHDAVQFYDTASCRKTARRRAFLRRRCYK